MDVGLKKSASMASAEQHKRIDLLLGRKLVFAVKLQSFFAKTDSLAEVLASAHWKRGRQNWSMAVSFTLPLADALGLQKGIEISISGQIDSWGYDNLDTAPYSRNLFLSNVRLLRKAASSYSNDKV
jgi:hypothetical protein